MYKDLLHFTKQKLNNNNLATVKVLLKKKLKCNPHTNGNEDVPNSYNSIIKMQKENKSSSKGNLEKLHFTFCGLKKIKLK